MNRHEQKEYQAWLELRKQIARQTEPIQDESERDKAKRITKLLGNFELFCNYYFPHYVKSPFGWFHKRAAREITKDPNIFAILEWPREHAKSVFADVLLPLYLKAKGELTGMMVASANQDKAHRLLSDIQAELMENKRYSHDFGQQYSLGNWADGHFVTTDGIGFWAFGRGQSPRGTRHADNRPNYGVVDDIDDAAICKNEYRVKEAVDWVLGDFFGALSIEGARLVIAGNRIHKKSILAYLVGDVEEDDPKRENIWHLKVYAIEDKRHRKAAATYGTPAWLERYTLTQLVDKMAKMGYRNAQREYFHNYIIDGHIFKNEHLIWASLPVLSKYEQLISYCDPSFKETKKNDYKAIVLIGKTGKYYDIIQAWVRQATTGAMTTAHYDIHEGIGDVYCPHYMEANFIQDMLLDEYDETGLSRGYMLAIRPDKRKKPDKYGRIENLSPLFERHLVRFNEAHRKNPDMQTLISQFLGFPQAHDDGPDAVEGAIFLINKRIRSRQSNNRTGSYRKNSKRKG